MMTRQRVLSWLAPRLMLGLALWRVLCGVETRADLAERLGRRGPRPGEVWLHGASIGELASVEWVVRDLAARGPVLVTASTVTGREAARGWGIAGLRVGLAPLDLGGAVGRFVAPGLAGMVNVEGEIWPRRLAALARAGVPVAWIGARLSERSARFWRRAGGLDMRAVRLASAQDAGSQERLAGLGVTGWVAPCDLKAEAIARRPAVVAAPRADRARVLLAASTHEGEEEAVLAAFAGSGAFDLLILAPRHPQRGDEIERAVRARGLDCPRRSKGAGLPPRGVYLADTLGEMDLWYAAAGVTLVGGSLVDRGGHTPWEPIRHGSAVLHGPHVGNFAAAYAALGACGGARAWAEGLGGLDGATQERMAAAARACLGRAGGDALLAGLLALVAGT